MSEYIIVVDGKIVDHICGAPPKDPTLDVRQVPDGFSCETGQPIALYDENWNKKDIVTLIHEGLAEVPFGYKLLKDDTLVPKTKAEMYGDGSLATPPGMIFDPVLDDLRFLTIQERITKGEIELNELQSLLINLVDNQFPKRLAAGFDWRGNTFGADPNMANLATSFWVAVQPPFSIVPFPTQWPDIGDKLITIATQDDLVDLFKTMYLFAFTIYRTVGACKIGIKAAQTVQEAKAAFDAGGWTI